MKKNLLLLASFMPIALFMNFAFFREEWTVFCLSMISAILLGLNYKDKMLNYLKAENKFFVNLLYYIVVIVSLLLNYFVALLWLLDSHSSSVIDHVIAIAYFAFITVVWITGILKVFNQFYKTF